MFDNIFLAGSVMCECDILSAVSGCAGELVVFEVESAYKWFCGLLSLSVPVFGRGMIFT